MAQRKVNCEVYTDRGIVGERGVDGKSAYEQAVEGGYQGTEEEFEQALASDISTVATNISSVNTAATNMAAIIEAPTAATNAQIWAEGTDSQVTPLGGEHSSKGWANIAKQYAESIGSALKYKGSVSTYSDLPSTGQQNGDVWNVLDTGANYAWTGTEWDKLSETVDLSGYIPTSQKGTASGVATLDTDGKVPTSQLPEMGSGSGFDFEGTKAGFDAAVAAGTITEDSVSLITDDVDGANVATKAELQAVDRSKADTALSNVLANIDYVVESKFPTEDDPRWYRVYKSGWVEQGGNFGSSFSNYQTITITLQKQMQDTHYSITITNSSNADSYVPCVSGKTPQNFIAVRVVNMQGVASWEAKGMGAN